LVFGGKDVYEESTIRSLDGIDGKVDKEDREDSYYDS
jgi:hypothetical protein